MNTHTLATSLVLLLGALGSFAEPAAVRPPCGRPVVPQLETNFPILAWTYYSFENCLDWDYTIDNWVRLGVNTPFAPTIGPQTDRAAFRQFLDRCRAAKLKVYLTDWRVGPSAVHKFIKTGDEEAYRQGCRAAKTDWADRPEVVGFYVFDEPDAAQAPRVFQAAKIMSEEIPGKQPFLNLLPWYEGAARRFGSPDLKSYLAKCAKASGLSYLGYDYYGHTTPAAEPFDGCFLNLRTWAEFAKETGIKWNVTMLCTEHFSYRIRSEIDFRWQLSVAAAMGANAVNWFYPDHHDDGHLNYRNAPINQLGERTSTFDWMGQEVRVFQHQFGRLFAQFAFERAFMVGKSFGGVPLFTDKDDPDLKALKIAGDPTSPLLVSFFTGKYGRYAAIVNLRKDADGSRNVKFVFADGVKSMQKMWDDWRALRPSNDAGLENLTGETGPVKSLSLYMAPGQLVVITLAR